MKFVWVHMWRFSNICVPPLILTLFQPQYNQISILLRHVLYYCIHCDILQIIVMRLSFLRTGIDLTKNRDTTSWRLPLFEILPVKEFMILSHRTRYLDDMIWCCMIWYMIYMIWYDMAWYMIWYDTIRYDTTRHDTTRHDMTWYDMIWYDMICDYDMIWYAMYDMIYLLTAIGLTPGGGSTVHIYTQTIHRTTQLTNWEECGPCPVFASYTLAFALQPRKKHG